MWDEGAKNYWNRIPQISAKEMQDRYKALPEREHKLAETAARLVKWTKEIDTTRIVTANLIIPVASLASGYAGALDVVGFSYQTNQYDWSKKNYPNMHFTGNENAGNWTEWNSIIESPMVYSMYMWTGIDYLGEANKKWPQKGWDGDLLDFAGFSKPGWDYFKSIWINKPNIAIGTILLKNSNFDKDSLSGKALAKSKKAFAWNNSKANTHWNYKNKEEVLVEVSSNHHVVELFLNGKSLGSRSMSECQDRIFRWVVPYQEGTLSAKAGFDGSEMVTEMKSTTAPVKIRLTVDNSMLTSDGYDVAHIVAQLVDKYGNEVKTEDVKITFDISDTVRVLGVDNGSNKSVQDYQSNSVITSQGRALVIVQSLREGGVALIKASSDTLESNTIFIEIE